MFIETIKLNSKINIGPKTAQLLEEENVSSIWDLVTLWPSKYLNYTITELMDGYCLVKGTVDSNVAFLRYRNNLNSLSFSVRINQEIIKVIIFNRPFLKAKILPGASFYIEGKYEKIKKTIVASNIYFKLAEDKITPIYNSKIPDGQLNKIIMNAIERYDEYIDEELPGFILKKYQLISFKEALRKIHNPSSMDDVKEATRRLKYEEFFRFQLKLQYVRSLIQKDTKTPKKWDVEQIRAFIATIPFELTDDQKDVVNDIFRDFKANYPANRLIQGDVGSGKTIVAAISLYAVALDNYQGVLMAPTEILAIQHYENLQKLFVNQNINIALLTSSVKGKKRNELLAQIVDGTINVVVGTHALLSEDVNYHNLGLVITDEQHRFGVNQRQLLRKKGSNPDVLYLTATPIPRTLAIGLFGDMDISTIKSMPRGRGEIKTKYVNIDMLDPVLSFMNKEIEKGNQAYIIAPLVEESDKMDLHNVLTVYETMKNHFMNYNVGLIHGKIKSVEKDQIMRDFKENRIQILVATTVVEVGVDNPNATIMLVLDAERYGLSQLHQLRGRIGRGNKKSYCFLASNKDDVARLQIIEGTTDGFQLAEEDLRLRGPGDFFGNRQSGMPNFKMGDIIKDFKIIEYARKDAQYIIEKDLLSRYRGLCKYLEKEMDNSSIFD